jgi:hypothetical protein
MDKANKFILDAPAVHTWSSSAFSTACSDPDLHIQDQRVSQLLVLLQQIDESAGGLEALPKRELSEIVSSAIRVCGFVDPIEARDVIATVLDAIGVQDPNSESP